MKVNELIEKLKLYGGDSEIAVVCSNQNFEGLREINEHFEIYKEEDINGDEVLIIEEVEM